MFVFLFVHWAFIIRAVSTQEENEQPFSLAVFQENLSPSANTFRNKEIKLQERTFSCTMSRSNSHCYEFPPYGSNASPQTTDEKKWSFGRGRGSSFQINRPLFQYE